MSLQSLFLGFEDGEMSYEVAFCKTGLFHWPISQGVSARFSQFDTRANGNGTISMSFLNACMLNSQEATLILCIEILPFVH